MVLLKKSLTEGIYMKPDYDTSEKIPDRRDLYET